MARPPSESRWFGPRGCHPAKVSSLLVPVLRAVCFAAALRACCGVAFGLMVLLGAAAPVLAQAPPEGGIVKGQRKIYVESEDGKGVAQTIKEYSISRGVHINVQ